MTWTLHSAWRATAPYRVRIGLQLKGCAYDYAPVDLIRGDQREPAYRAVNPQGLTPALDLGDGTVLAQSLAILEWLEETIPLPAILPKAPLDRAMVRRMALIVACDIHPLNNTRVGRKLNKLGLSQEATSDWIQGWIREGFDALERLRLRRRAHHRRLLPDPAGLFGQPLRRGPRAVPGHRRRRRTRQSPRGLHRRPPQPAA
jgi:maleylacetoacetate isomerase